MAYGTPCGIGMRISIVSYILCGLNNILPEILLPSCHVFVCNDLLFEFILHMKFSTIDGSKPVVRASFQFEQDPKKLRKFSKTRALSVVDD